MATAEIRDQRFSKTALDALGDRFDGQLVRPSDPDYDQARRVWNGMIDKYPALIARCTGTADVVAAVNFARENKLLVAVRGGGHNVAGYATCDGGIVIDLSPMNAVRVDPARCTARAQGGATWGQLDSATQAFGLATPGGEVSETGIAGLTLSGGVGSLRRKYGLSCDNLVSAEVVTADGRVLTASEEENADLFWGLRGGGGNFGIVTEFEYRLHEVGPEVATLTVAYPLGRAKEIVPAWLAFTASAPDEVSSTVLVWSVPAIPDFPVELHGRAILVLADVYAGDTGKGERLFEPLRKLGEPLFDLSGIVPYVESQSAFDDFFPDGDRYYWKSLYCDELSDAAIETLLAWMQDRPSPRSLVAIRHLGGAISRVGESDTAFGNRAARFNFSIDATWSDPADDEANMRWARDFWQAMRPHSNGAVYLNFPGLLEEGEALVRGAHTANYAKLAALKNRYDPANLFQVNQNIRPADKL
jgi:FAD/FMN-containing dehydrogenase